MEAPGYLSVQRSTDCFMDRLDRQNSETTLLRRLLRLLPRFWQIMTDTLGGGPVKSSIQMASAPELPHTNGHAPQFEMGRMAYDESGCEEERLMDNVATKAHKSIPTTDRTLDDVHKYWNFKLLRCHLWRSIVVIFFQNKTNLLFPFGPAAAIAASWNMKHGWVFLFSLLGITPLAERLGFLTEQLTFYTGSTVGGLLNATFGNATEMIISIYALKHGMIRVVQQSLLGSILSNMLLVLGCAFFTGGIVHNRKDQTFCKGAAAVNSGLLLMAVMGLLFPAVLHSTHTELHAGRSELALSRFTSCIMLIAYAVYLFFQLKSHRDLYECCNEGDDEGGSEEKDSPHLKFWEAIIWLAILTAFVSFLSDYLVNAIEGASKNWNMPVSFMSVILLPIVGNAAEHASAIMFAMKDKLDITLGVAIGSSTQISMFVIPFCVVVGWIMGRPMDLNFHVFETASLFITVIVVAFMLQDGTSNYFKGLMLILCYLIVAASFFVHIDSKGDDDSGDV
ncbi:vacuolar cation/proton exchanger 3 isoform X1 [Cryptomeria japonica]|uniref:vacuolar cation/proton exchanger 3 isoform X1 n=3 Tax=Cryptomeria japonica TaxID=3369 RepID=UPI0027DA811A|nr:vacuolar cation/proton exchanger 3 isoform X1 [Cryptomeria japonica]XP_057845348.2 vacuolar cation/proton exchanger 3 isoform X1 [Cryptomeria japonica]XP_057845350.2 vacuolar cation/proton exchanger 3 isoform X1 [Cryptomeria japonica]